MAQTRSVLVEAHRLEGWLTRFHARNGPYIMEPDPGSEAWVRIIAANGCAAVLMPPLPVGPGSSLSAPSSGDHDVGPGSPSLTRDHGAELVAALLGRLDLSLPVGLLLIRRGGYSVGVARQGRILASKTGTRYVQGRTAAGGWSQQRFARRRANQAAGLVEETAGRAAALLAAHPPSFLQLGGDRTLAGQVLAEPILRAWAGLPQTPFLTVQDPRYTVLEEAARSALSIRITLTDPPVAS